MKALSDDSSYCLRVAAQAFSPYFNYIGALEGVFPEDEFAEEHPEINLWFQHQMSKLPLKGYWTCFAIIIIQMIVLTTFMFILDNLRYNNGTMSPSKDISESILPAVNIMSLEKTYSSSTKPNTHDEIIDAPLSKAKAVDNVSLDIGYNESYILVGPNGAGKSTI